MKPRTFWISDRLYSQVQTLADRREMSASGVAVAALSEYVARALTPEADHARRDADRRPAAADGRGARG